MKKKSGIFIFSNAFFLRVGTLHAQTASSAVIPVKQTAEKAKAKSGAEADKKAAVPDLTAEEEAKLLGFLKQAREQAIDHKSRKEISAIFEIYKTNGEQYLNGNGRTWRELFRVYGDKVKKEKAQKQTN